MEPGYESEEEKAARLVAEKARLNALLAEGKIDGVEYNKQIVKLMVPEKRELEKRKIREREPRPSKKRLAIEIIVAVAILIIAAIPTAINLNWHFYFQNTLAANGVPDYSKMVMSSISEEPIQIDFDEYEEAGEYKGRPIDIAYKAYYDITGMVTSVHDYWGWGAYDTLVPRDVCLVWGSLANNYLEHEVEFSQRRRFCYARIDGVEIDDLNYTTRRGKWGNTTLALREFSNNHIIASTPEVRQAVFDLKAGDTVRLTGYLVRVAYDDIVLDSSMSREDNGNGACEVFYVTSISPVFNTD